MRIAQVTPVYPPYRGGMGQVAFEYTTRLQSLGHEVEVFVPSLPIMNAGFLARLPQKNNFDLVHLHYPFYGGAEQIAAFGNVPMVLTYHMDAKAYGFKERVFNLHRALLQPIILKRAKKIMVSSFDYAKHSALNGTEEDKWEEMPFGVDPVRFSPLFTPNEEGLKQKIGIFDDAPVIIFVGGLDEAHVFKGMPILLQALKNVSEPYHLLVVGDGDLRSSFEATARLSAKADKIHFVGSVSHEDLPSYYRIANFHVFPSTSQAEAFGLVALEAAATGIPSIASDLPGVRTVVRDQETGILVPPGDARVLQIAIEHLLKNDAWREKLGVQARHRVLNEYSWDKLIEKMLKLYEQALL